MILFSRKRLGKILICQNFLKGEGPTLNLLSNTSQRAKTLCKSKVTTYVIGSKFALLRETYYSTSFRYFRGNRTANSLKFV